jgi:molybdate transport system permease protein
MNPILVSITVSFAAAVLGVPPAIAVAWMLERTRWPGRGLVHTIVLLPLVLPPVVVGYILLKIFSPRGGPLGFLPIAFHWGGAVVAAAVAGFPLLVMYISMAFKNVDRRLEVMSRSLGRTPWQTFWRVTLPLSWTGILAGALLSFARGLGEFGATIVLAGRIPGETETIPLAIYAALDQPGGESRIYGLIAASIILCLAGVLGFRALNRPGGRTDEI